MHNTKDNFQLALIGTLLVVGAVFHPKTAFPAGIADRTKPDPILAAPANGPCDAALDQPDLTPGTDVEGHQVASANIATGPIPLEGQIAVPLRPARGNSTYVMVDGKKLDPLLNPKPPCK
ncbi:MAG TPA: hypothetical protein VG798_02815 [Rhizomicrobium sp.]|nr:hypothetical protein [Rhizomicrobium sp.]